mgnify:CR=1 FL=1
MLIKIVALIVGFFTFVIVVSIIQLIGGMVFSAPTAEMMADPASMAEFVSKMPIGAFIMLLLGYAIGSFASGFLMRTISKWDSLILPIVISALGMLGWILTIFAIPHPTWVTIVGFLCFVPFTILGHKTAR